MKKKKRKKRKNHFLNIMLTFGGVFTGVMILGILAFLLLWKIGDERADGNSLDKPAEAVSNMVPSWSRNRKKTSRIRNSI